MCTVTYLPLGDNEFVLTSSRDVPFSRKKSLFPENYIENGVTLTYPKDGKAGGTWIGTSNKKRLICLLNGAFENHKTKEKYVKSRGIIVKDLLKVDDITLACKSIDLKGIEPFTMVIVEWDFHLFLYEFVWDGTQKHLKILPQEIQIWSSSTLYTKAMKAMRRDWFNDWVVALKEKNEKVKANKKKIDILHEILDFHHHAGIGNAEVDVLMKRPSVGTVSITQVSKLGENVNMEYEEIT